MYYLGLPLAQKVNEGDEFILSKHFFLSFSSLDCFREIGNVMDLHMSEQLNVQVQGNVF